jgi:DNA-binding LacI/PurR family transcriptional regulator
VVNNEGEISNVTRGRVLATIDEMGYRPNLLARGLVAQRTCTIGLVIPDICNPFWGEVTRGIRFEVAMRGALGIGASLNELSDAEMKDYATYIAFYKRVRHVVQDGDLYRLQRLEEYGASVVQYVLPNGEEAVYSVAVRDHLISEHRPNALLKALNAGATYSVLNRHNTEVHRATGYELMTQGIPGDTDKGAAMGRTLYVKKIG